MPFHHPDPDPEPPTREAALTSQKEEMEAMKASRAEREEALTTQLEAMSQETQDLRQELHCRICQTHTCGLYLTFAYQGLAPES